MTISQRYNNVLSYFLQHMPVAETELHYADPFGLVVAVILSAQCTDKRVNMITPHLLEKYPTAEAMAQASPDDIFRFISSCSYPNNKAKHLWGMAAKLVKDFSGKVPEAFDDLLSLPGVGRKTANVITLVAFNKPAMPVDTHVFRVSARIGLTRGAKTPEAAEKQLTSHIPVGQLYMAHHWLILHGRYTCTARKPKCSECGIREFCKFYEDINRS